MGGGWTLRYLVLVFVLLMSSQTFSSLIRRTTSRSALRLARVLARAVPKLPPPNTTIFLVDSRTLQLASLRTRILDQRTSDTQASSMVCRTVSGYRPLLPLGGLEAGPGLGASVKAVGDGSALALLLLLAAYVATHLDPLLIFTRAAWEGAATKGGQLPIDDDGRVHNNLWGAGCTRSEVACPDVPGRDKILEASMILAAKALTWRIRDRCSAGSCPGRQAGEESVEQPAAGSSGGNCPETSWKALRAVSKRWTMLQG